MKALLVLLVPKPQRQHTNSLPVVEWASTATYLVEQVTYAPGLFVSSHSTSHTLATFTQLPSATNCGAAVQKNDA